MKLKYKRRLKFVKRFLCAFENENENIIVVSVVVVNVAVADVVVTINAMGIFLIKAGL